MVGGNPDDLLDDDDLGDADLSGGDLGDGDGDSHSLSVLVYCSVLSGWCWIPRVILTTRSVCVCLFHRSGGGGERNEGTFQRGEVGRQIRGSQR